MLSKEIISTIRSYQETLRSQANKGFEARLASGLAREMANTFDVLLGDAENAKPAKKLQVTHVSGDDWEGIYIDGKLVEEGHNVQLRDFAKHVGITLQEIEADLEWLEDEGSLPEVLLDVKVATR